MSDDPKDKPPSSTSEPSDKDKQKEKGDSSKENPPACDDDGKGRSEDVIDSLPGHKDVVVFK
ncbi:uncharacterized protein FPRO_16122 [Fusarium proliferatum ET1]|uniref:Uncharacterized protein n=1 Tax=Fusarium proliferatum (strain ET1) TaxID=1227346 RepID=A0A1L7WBB9_FUSPR|nr:uncharacterized protein FPRO_16122 [Fusarium proliferatum ET1]CZR49917.1 uncharacterized protein FPRO_16122 [Fusarium proliferatum ET1]